MRSSSDYDRDDMAEYGQAAEMVARIAAGDARALARAISLAEDGAAGAEAVVAGCQALVQGRAGRRGRRMGITGAPGVGKSTVVDALIRELRRVGERVGVVAVDPTSPYTGGALLGDRIRMQGFTGDAGVWIRSLASRRAPGGVTRTTEAVCELMEAAGFGTILVETVGVGQDEVDVAEMVQATVLVLVPGMGDDVQSLKAGVMEVADFYVVNKGDLPGADRVEAEVRAMQSLVCEDGAWVPPVLRTVATTGEGVPELLRAVEEFLAFKTGYGR